MSIGATALIPDDLLAMPNGKSFELVDEEPLELKMGRESGWIAGVIFGQFLRCPASVENGIGFWSG